MNISGPAAVAKPEMLFYAPGDLTVTDKNQKCQTPGQKNFPFTYYYNPNRAKWPGMEPGNKKSSKSFSDLLLSLAAGGGGYLIWEKRYFCK